MRVRHRPSIDDPLRLLLRGNRQAASQLILTAVARGVTVKDIYLHVFQRTQYEIGRLWQINRISVAQEHFCTAATQLIMSQLYPHIFRTERVGRRLVATCVGGARLFGDLNDPNSEVTIALRSAKSI